ncbi:MAG: aminotransferase class III-fold pyridoxal phosphate-dependent enzyme [bacterium]|nr:aminotransferase class III-fold pyridoxal phosphate-dependent enzyme [bacterium]
MNKWNDIERASVMHTWTAQEQWNGPTIVGGSGAVFWDTNNKRYIDMSSMAECSNLGHQHPAVVAAIKRQADKMCFVTSAWGSDPRAELAAKLLEVSGFAGGRVFFTTGGADANENAVKMALWASGKTSGKIITRYRSYHGASFATMELSGDDRGAEYPPGGLRVVHVLPPYCYRCPFHARYNSCGILCAETIDEIIAQEGSSKVTAVLMEPAAGTNGIAAPPEYWPKLREITSRYGVLLIADEVMSGFGRVGEWFAWQKHGEAGRPDIMTIAKGLTGAHVPLGAVIVSKEVAAYFDFRKLQTGLTYSGHPLACAAGVAAIDAYRDEQLITRSRALGAKMHEALRSLATKHCSIGDVRGEGLFAILELVKNRETKEPLSTWPKIAPALKTLVAEGRKLGVSFAVRGNLIVIAPPLVISTPQLCKAIVTLDQLLVLCDAETQQ